MDQESIETFLAVYECRNLTQAARRLYTTQGTVSHRLQLLEDELGVTLFERARGKRSISATDAGEEFLPIAHQWMAVFKSSQELSQNAQRVEVVVGGTDLINNFTFAPLYRKLLERNSELRLRVRTHHTGELYEMVENRQVDLGLVFGELAYAGVVSKPLYHERMYLVCHRESPYQDGVSPGELPAEQEVYLEWGADYAAWHNRHWRPGSYLVHCGTGSQAIGFLDEPGRWAIVPWSLYESLLEPGSLAIRTLSEEPPQRTCYQIVQRDPLPRSERALKAIEPELEEYVETLTAIGPMTGA